MVKSNNNSQTIIGGLWDWLALHEWVEFAILEVSDVLPDGIDSERPDIAIPLVRHHNVVISFRWVDQVEDWEVVLLVLIELSEKPLDLLTDT